MLRSTPPLVETAPQISQETLISLDQALQDNPFDFDLCNQLINGYGQLGDEASVTRYREHAVFYCPTTEEFWVAWIQACKEKLFSAATAEDELAWERHIIQLYRGSVAACPTADLWVSYLKFLKQRKSVTTNCALHASTISAAHLRRTCETAVRDLGLHGTEGPKIWSVYRHIEQQILQEMLQRMNPMITDTSATVDGPDALNHDTLSNSPMLKPDLLKAVEQQVEYIRNLFCRQMRLPLAGLQDLWDEYRIFEAELPPELRATAEATANIVTLHESGLAEWERRKALELQVMMSDDDKIETIQRLSAGWTEYIKFERELESDNREARVNTLYLRACEDLGHLRVNLWFAWSHWVLTKLQDPGRAAMILDRAGRLHPTNCKLWTAYLGCQRFRKLADVARKKQIFCKALRGIDVLRHPEDVPTLCSAAVESVLDRSGLRNAICKEDITCTPTTASSKKSADLVHFTDEGRLVDNSATRSSKNGKMEGLKTPSDVIEAAPSATSADIHRVGWSTPAGSEQPSTVTIVTDVYQKSEEMLLKALEKHLYLNRTARKLTPVVLSNNVTTTSKGGTIFVVDTAQTSPSGKISVEATSVVSDPLPGFDSLNQYDDQLRENFFAVAQRLWRDWLGAQAAAITVFAAPNLKLVERVARRLLFCSSSDKLSIDFLALLDDTNVDWAVLMRKNAVPGDSANTNGEDWALVAKAFILVCSPPELYDHIHELMQFGQKIIVTHLDIFLIRWHQLAQMAQRRDVASAIASSLKNINIGDESVSASPSSPSIFINSVTQSNRTPASLWPVHGLTGADDNQSVDSLFLHTDTSVMQVTLEQLKSRREKRRRRYSECDSEAALSDTSSDSGSVPCSFAVTTGPSSLLKKRFRGFPGASLTPGISAPAPSVAGSSSVPSSPGHSPSSSAKDAFSCGTPVSLPASPSGKWNMSAHAAHGICAPISPTNATATTSPCLSSASDTPVFSKNTGLILGPSTAQSLYSSETKENGSFSSRNAAETLGLSSEEINLLERATRSTWDGHECGDPATAPPVPPITSAMSPLRRRSFSNSSTSSLPSAHLSPSSLSSEVSLNHALASPPPQPSFATSAEHQSAVPTENCYEADQEKRFFLDDGKRAVSPAFANNDRIKAPCSSNKTDGEPTKRARHTDDVEQTFDKMNDAVLPPNSPVLKPKMGNHYKYASIDLQNREISEASRRQHLVKLMGQTVEESTVFVSNLDASVTKEDIERLFADVGGLQEIRLVYDKKQRFKGFGYIDFLTPEDAHAAVKNHQNVVWNDRQIKVNISQPTVPTYEPKTLFFSMTLSALSDLPEDFLCTEIANAVAAETERRLRRLIRPVSVRPRVDSTTGKLKGYGYVDFNTQEDAAAVSSLFMNESIAFVGATGTFTLAPSIPMKSHRPILAPRSKKFVAKQQTADAEPLRQPQSNVLFVKNLKFSTTEDQLRAHFEKMGEVDKVLLCRDDKGKSKGFGFVSLASEQDTFSCRMLNDSSLDGREIVVSTSHRIPTEPHPQSIPAPISHRAPRQKPRIRLNATENDSLFSAVADDGNVAKSCDATNSARKPLRNKEFRQFLEHR